MRLHKRVLIVQEAGNVISSVLLQFQHDRGLTDIEMLQLLGQEEQRILKYMLRVERHGNADTPAGEE